MLEHPPQQENQRSPGNNTIKRHLQTAKSVCKFYASSVYTVSLFVDTMPVPVDDGSRKQAILLMDKAVFQMFGTQVGTSVIPGEGLIAAVANCGPVACLRVNPLNPGIFYRMNR